MWLAGRAAERTQRRLSGIRPTISATVPGRTPHLLLSTPETSRATAASTKAPDFMARRPARTGDCSRGAARSDVIVPTS